jgi:AraC-like DNA-binding protein
VSVIRSLLFVEQFAALIFMLGFFIFTFSFFSCLCCSNYKISSVTSLSTIGDNKLANYATLPHIVIMSNIELYQYPISYIHTAAKSWVHYGVDTATLLKFTNIDTDKLVNPDATVSGEELQRLIVICTHFNNTGIPDSILVAEQFSFTNVGLLGLAIPTSEDFGSVLDLLTRFLSASAPGLTFDYQVSSEDLFIDYQMDKGFGDALPFFNEVVVCVMHRFAELFQKKLLPSSVYFAHTPKYPIKLYEQFLECPVHTNHDVNRLCFHVKDLQAQLKHPDSSTFSIIEEQLKTTTQKEQSNHSWSQKIADIWHKNAEQQIFLSQKQMADKLHLSPRTLVRRLADEGCSYRSMVQQWRLDKAKTLLKKSEMPISQIAAHIGFDDESAFFRFFKDSEEMTPRNYRVS